MITKSDFFLRDFNHATQSLGNSNLFNILEPIVLENNSTRLFKTEYRLNTSLPPYNSLIDFDLTVSINDNSRSRKSVAYWNPLLQTIIYGVLISNRSDATWFTCQHFTCFTTNDGIHFLNICNGCTLFPAAALQKACTFTIEASRIFKFHFKKKRGSPSKIVSSILLMNFCVLRLYITMILLLTHLHPIF